MSVDESEPLSQISVLKLVSLCRYLCRQDVPAKAWESCPENFMTERFALSSSVYAGIAKARRLYGVSYTVLGLTFKR